MSEGFHFYFYNMEINDDDFDESIDEDLLILLTIRVIDLQQKVLEELKDIRSQLGK